MLENLEPATSVRTTKGVKPSLEFDNDMATAINKPLTSA